MVGSMQTSWSGWLLTTGRLSGYEYVAAVKRETSNIVASAGLIGC